MLEILYNNKILYAERGALLSDALFGVHSADMPCGGHGTCGKCRVLVKGMVSAPSVQEAAVLNENELASGMRLACQCKVLGSCAVSGTENGSINVCADGLELNTDINPDFKMYGAAVDLGTTTIAARLYNAEGRLLASASAENPQAVFGADVVSRIEASIAGKSAELKKAACEAISKLIKQMAADAEIEVSQISKVVIAANTAMLYLLTEKSPKCLAAAPFEPDCLFGLTISARELALCCETAAVYLPRCMSAFVGADITAAVLASQICQKDETAVLADLGTNGEIALWHKGRLLCCSTAAGPAFEGAGLSCGMAGKPGAIDRVFVNESAISVKTIADKTPKGICGSGIIDAIAAFLQIGLLDESGYIDDDSLELAPDISVSQKDIRMVQLAKSAICAGIKTLCDIQSIDYNEVKRLYIAGGFGSYVRLESAETIGLLPENSVEKAECIGNASLVGASMLLLNKSTVSTADNIAKGSDTADLSCSQSFKNYYVDGMMF